MQRIGVTCLWEAARLRGHQSPRPGLVALATLLAAALQAGLRDVVAKGSKRPRLGGGEAAVKGRGPHDRALPRRGARERYRHTAWGRAGACGLDFPRRANTSLRAREAASKPEGRMGPAHSASRTLRPRFWKEWPQQAQQREKGRRARAWEWGGGRISSGPRAGPRPRRRRPVVVLALRCSSSVIAGSMMFS